MVPRLTNPLRSIRGHKSFLLPWLPARQHPLTLPSTVPSSVIRTGRFYTMSKFNGSRYAAIKQGGPFEVLEYEASPPGPSEVLIRTKAVALNPVDWKQL